MLASEFAGRSMGSASVIVLVLSMLVLLVLGVLIGYAIGISSLVYVVLISDMSPLVVVQRISAGADTMVLLALPFFLLAGEIMNAAGITKRLTRLALALVGPVIPPSIGFIIYTSVSGVSVGKLFLAGTLPGILIAAAIIVVCAWVAGPAGHPRGPRHRFREVAESFWVALPGLLMPAIILGGIFGGLVKPDQRGQASLCWPNKSKRPDPFDLSHAQPRRRPADQEPHPPPSAPGTGRRVKPNAANASLAKGLAMLPALSVSSRDAAALRSLRAAFRYWLIADQPMNNPTAVSTTNTICRNRCWFTR